MSFWMSALETVAASESVVAFAAFDAIAVLVSGVTRRHAQSIDSIDASVLHAQSTDSIDASVLHGQSIDSVDASVIHGQSFGSIDARVEC
jgi:hypothetical protein